MDEQEPQQQQRVDEKSAIKKGPHLLDEADVGSGEKSRGQQDTDALIEKIAERPPQPGGAEPASDDATKKV